jgi:soluble lytic murein transglycosylase
LSRFPGHSVSARSWWIAVFVTIVVLNLVLILWWAGTRHERQAEVHIAAASRRYGVEPALVKAVVWRESRFRPGARGKAGELGLMQVGALAAREWAEAERVRAFDHGALLDPGSNVLAGTWYLSRLLRRYLETDDPVPYALADYNAGRSNVRRWIHGAARTNSGLFLTQIDFPGTRRYVSDVLARREEYRSRAGRGLNPR